MMAGVYPYFVLSLDMDYGDWVCTGASEVLTLDSCNAGSTKVKKYK